MKKIFTKLMLLAVAATAFVSCENNWNDENPVVELLQDVTLTAEKPSEVRTELIEGVPYWSKGDAIGVYLEDNTKHYKFENDAEEASLTATFKGQTAVANTLFVYYPYNSTGVAEKGAKVDIPVNQEPTATSFDGKADIMLAKPVQLDEEGKQLSDLEFARLGAIVKVVLNDKTGNLADQHVSAFSMTADSYLTGRVYIDVKNQTLNGWCSGQSKDVKVTYTEAIAANNPVYLIVYPQTLAAESKLSIEATTEGYAISKEITLPSDIVLESGKVTTLNVSLATENVVAEATGLALPFEDDFSWAEGNSSSQAVSATMLPETYSAVNNKVYPQGGYLKFGSGTSGDANRGELTTVELNLSQPFTVVVDAKTHGSDTSYLEVTVGETTMMSDKLGSDYSTYTFKFDAASAKATVKFKVSGTRGYIDNLHIVAGHDYVLPPVLTVSASEISGVSHEGEAKTFTYSVANPVEGTTATVTDNVEWITTADNNGTVTVTVAANDAEEAREGVITVAYTGAESKTVTVKQSAKPADGGSEGGVVTGSVTYTVSSTSACTTSGTAPTGSSVTYKQTYNTKEQITANNSATFTLSGYTGATIKAITLNMKSNASRGAGKFSAVAGSTTLAAISSAINFNTWYDNTSFGSSYRDVHVTLTNNAYVIQSGENVVIKLEGTTNSIYIHSVTIDYEIGGGNAGGNAGGNEGGNTGGETPDPENPGTGGGDEPSTGGEEVTTKYTFSNYTAGTQYADNEVHKLDDVLTITTTDCHFTTQLRIYSSTTYNGYAIGTLTGATIKSLGFSAGNKKDTLNVYGSTDGSTWTLVEGVSITSESYNDYTVDFGDTNYTYFKLDVAGANQIRISTLTLTYIK